MNNRKIIVYMADPRYRDEAEKLAGHLQVPLTDHMPDTADLVLLLDESGLRLTDGKLTLRENFTQMLPRLKQQNLEREYLIRAARIRHADHPLKAIDATAGLGEDSLLLAARGFDVQMYEADPVIAALLRDALRRAEAVPELTETVLRMHLHEEDSIQAMKKYRIPPDVILLDPMFPARQKSALVKKKFQLLQQLERPCGNGEELLDAARALHPAKIVIKRPLKGPYLGDAKPGYSIRGKAIRYDCLTG